MAQMTFDQFQAQHGDEPIIVNGRYLFPDGATSDGRRHVLPPSHVPALLRLQAEYLTAKAQVEEDKFRQSLQPKVETYLEFRKRHGDDAIRVRNRLLFSDGAMATDYVQCDPPGNDYARLQLQVEYYEEQVRRAEENFHDAKSNIQAYGASAESPDIIKHLQATVRAHRKSLADVEKQLSNTPEEKARRKREQFQMEQRAREAARLAEVNRIKI